ncbi:hypothetical protein [Streptomyces indicus]|uniref:Uncharacterized protein n=1 Tax=Streptomyces indicus TaxID=417292 RepID=A0A1G8V054_9ACTN|nr:hypothetical protein [Streptomyces indicus]SDJ59423.1 hypothetical protein SAMN05421806_1011172 [Streptomyces indicus]
MSSIPGPGGAPQPNPYQQPSPQPPQAPVQQNPYAQQAPPPFPQQAAPGVPGAPGMPGAPGVQPGFGAPVPPPAPRKGIPGWVWGIGGVVVASAVWAGALFATGNLGSPGADLGGYAYEKDLCSVAQMSSFEDRYEKGTEENDETKYSSKRPSVDQSYCSLDLKDKQSTDEYSSTYLTYNATWHKKADPEPEYADLAKSNEDYDYEGSKTIVTKLDGLGDEAWLTTETSDTDDELNRMELNVREGWFTFRMGWSDYSASSSGDSKVPSAVDVEKWLVADAKATLKELRE